MAKRKLTQIFVGTGKTKFERSGVVDNIYDWMIDGLDKRDEDILREAVITLMESFLKDKITLDFLSFTTSAFLDTRVVEEKYQDFEFRDKVLAHVYSKLNVMEYETEEEAKKKVQDLLEKLKKRV